MGTSSKQEMLTNMPLEFLIEFGHISNLFRNYRRYFSKKDFVQHLARNLTYEECVLIYKQYRSGLHAKMIGQEYLNKHPNASAIAQILRSRLVAEVPEGVIIHEFPIFGSRVDLVLINGYSRAFEIKSPRDNITRLQKQLRCYKRVFEEIYLVCPREFEIGELDVGMYRFIVDGGVILSHERDANQNDALDPLEQLRLLRKTELSSMLSPNLKDMSRIEMIREIMRGRSPKEINDTFKQLIGNRYSKT